MSGPVRPDPEQLAFEPRSCPLCAGSDSRRLFSDVNRREGWRVWATVVECRRCGMRYLDPAPDDASLARLYAAGVVDRVPDPASAVPATAGDEAPARPRAARKSRRFLRSLNGLLRGHPHDWPDEEGHGRSILDFGCLDGSKLVRWRERGWRVAGIDLNELGIETARRRMPEGQFWVGDLLQLDVEQRFDAIRSDNVIEHLRDPGAYLARLAGLLKPGGTMQVIVPNASGLTARALGKYSPVYWMPFHITLYTPATLHAALAGAGLSAVRVATFTPVGYFATALRQRLLAPGFDRRGGSGRDQLIRATAPVWYGAEVVAQRVGLGEEVIGYGVKVL